MRKKIPYIEERYGEGINLREGKKFLNICVYLNVMCTAYTLWLSDTTTKEDIQAFKDNVYNDLIDYSIYYREFNVYDKRCVETFFKPHVRNDIILFLC